MISVYAGTAPDGMPLLVSVDWSQEELCPATFDAGVGVLAQCMLRPGHPGPWHVAATETAIVEVWPAQPAN